MRSFTYPLLTTILLMAKLALAQGHPPPWASFHGHGPPNPGQGQPPFPGGQIDPLSSGDHWGPAPGPVILPPHDQGRQFSNFPPDHPPFDMGGPGGNHGGAPGVPGGDSHGAASLAASAAAGPLPSGLTHESDFPPHPTPAIMYTYVPKSFRKGSPVIVLLHHCDGNGPGYAREYPDWFRAADSKGYLLIYPSSPGETGGCWDVSSRSSLHHDGGGDSQTIAEMVKFAQKKYGCSSHQVYAVGHSSGAMLTQVLGAVYPDMFLAGAAYSGVPAGCFRTDRIIGRDWNSTCTGEALHESEKYWVDQAKEMYPGYKGSWTRMMLVHGKADPIVHFNEHLEAVKQWCGLHNLDANRPTKKYKLQGEPNYEVSVYGSDVMAVAADGVTHNNPAKVGLTLQFFGLQ